jgi:Fe-S-cluster containining protein
MSEKIHYQCQRCTKCCQWPGFVKLDGSETAAIAKYLDLGEGDFIQRFTRLRPQRNGLALMDQADGSCIFLDGKSCAIQPVKPQQCRDFPNKWNFPGWREICEAVPGPVE